MKKVFCSILFVFLIVALPFMTIKVQAQATAIFVDPANVQNIAVGNTFTVNLNVSGAQNLFTWQTLLLFNSSVLSCEKAEYPPNNIFAGKPTVPVTPIIDNVLGSVTFGCSLSGADSFAGSGIMCNVTFKVLSVGQSPLNFSTPYGSDTFLLDGDLNVISSVNVQNGFFTNVPAPPQERHDVAVTSISLSNDHPTQGNNVTITVHALNNGTVTETFNVEASVDSTPIETQTITSLGAGSDITLTFMWNSSAASVGVHTITATAVSVPTDADPTNNAKSAKVTVMSSTGPSTDVNGDSHVDMKDVGIIAHAFGTREGESRWDPSADVNGDGFVNLFDLAFVVKDFWKK